MPLLSDFMTSAEQRHGQAAPKGVDPCRWRAMSVFTLLGDAISCAKTHKLGNYIFRVVLKQQHGRLMPTPQKSDSHHSLWPCDDANRLSGVTFECQV